MSYTGQFLPLYIYKIKIKIRADKTKTLIGKEFAVIQRFKRRENENAFFIEGYKIIYF